MKFVICVAPFGFHISYYIPQIIILYSSNSPQDNGVRMLAVLLSSLQRILYHKKFLLTRILP